MSPLLYLWHKGDRLVWIQLKKHEKIVEQDIDEILKSGKNMQKGLRMSHYL